MGCLIGFAVLAIVALVLVPALTIAAIAALMILRAMVYIERKLKGD